MSSIQNITHHLLSDSKKLKLSQGRVMECISSLIDADPADIFHAFEHSEAKMVKLFLENLVFPFSQFNSEMEGFPFRSKAEKRLMSLSVKYVLRAARVLFVKNKGEDSVLRFKKVDWKEYGLDIFQKIPKNLKSMFIGSNPKLPDLKSRKKIPTTSILSLTNKNPGNPSKEIKKLSLKRVVSVVPNFEKKNENLPIHHKRRLRMGEKHGIKWFEYDPEFGLEHWTKNFSFGDFDTIVHEFGVQGFLIKHVFDNFFKNSSVFVLSKENQIEPAFANQSYSENLGESLMVKGGALCFANPKIS